MTEDWKYQLRIDLAEPFAERARQDIADAALKPLAVILARHDATLTCQYDAFAAYLTQAEERGLQDEPLYKWTRATIENPAKTAKYLKSFTLYLKGEEVYAKAKADALEAELTPLVGGGLITRLSKHDTNPANNPQPPARYRK